MVPCYCHHRILSKRMKEINFVMNNFRFQLSKKITVQLQKDRSNIKTSRKLWNQAYGWHLFWKIWCIYKLPTLLKIDTLTKLFNDRDCKANYILGRFFQVKRSLFYQMYSSKYYDGMGWTGDMRRGLQKKILQILF